MAPMSGNMASKPPKRVAQRLSKPRRKPGPCERRKVDARTLRTHNRLGTALMELMQQRPFASITVQDVLDRAAVGRSTFYLHFTNKSDLLLSQLEFFLETMSTDLTRRKEESDRIAAVAEMFAHITAAQKVYHALGDCGRLNDFYD